MTGKKGKEKGGEEKVGEERRRDFACSKGIIVLGNFCFSFVCVCVFVCDSDIKFISCCES